MIDKISANSILQLIVLFGVMQAKVTLFVKILGLFWLIVYIYYPDPACRALFYKLVLKRRL